MATISLTSTDLAELAILYLVAAFLTYKITSWIRAKKTSQYKLPPGPPTWPIIGNMALLMDKKRLPHEVLMDLAEVYGPVMMLKLGSMTMIYITDPAMTEECLKVNDKLLANRPNFAASKYLLYGEHTMSMASYGDHWRFARKLFLSQLLSIKRVQQFEGVRKEELALIVQEVFQASKANMVMNMRDMLSKLATNVLTRMCMGKRLFASNLKSDLDVKVGATPMKQQEHSSGRKLRLAISSIFELFNQFMFEDFIPSLAWVDKVTGTRNKMQKTKVDYDHVMEELVDDHLKALEVRKSMGEGGEGMAHDFLDVLLLFRKEARGGSSDHLDNLSIKAFLLDVISAGTETTTTQTEWVFTHLLANPEVMAKAQAEVDSIVGKDRCVNETDTENMPYIHAIFKEVLRLYTGPHLLPRSNLVDCKIGGYDIPANSCINFQVYAMHHDGRQWEDPEKFNPDRFLQRDLDFSSGKQYYYMPFGTGRRMCPGYNLAARTIHTSIATLIHSFDWSLPAGMTPHELDRSVKVGLTILKQTPLEAIPIPRLPAHLY